MWLNLDNVTSCPARIPATLSETLESALQPRIYHRNLERAVRAAPDPSMVGLSFSELAPTHGRDAIEVFLNSVAKWRPVAVALSRRQ